MARLASKEFRQPNELRGGWVGASDLPTLDGSLPNTEEFGDLRLGQVAKPAPTSKTWDMAKITATHTSDIMREITPVSIPENPFGGNVRRLREHKKWTAIQLADAIGLGGNDQTKRVGVSNYEAGRRKPSRPVLQAMANAFDVTIDDLCNTVISIVHEPYEDGWATMVEKIPIRRSTGGVPSVESDTNQISGDPPWLKDVADIPGPEPVTEAILLQLLIKHQELLAEQQAIMDRRGRESASLMENQRQDTARLTEVLVHQQALLAKQQDHFFAQQQWQQQQVASREKKLQDVIDSMAAKLTSLEGQLNARAQSSRPPRGRQQLFDSPGAPGLAGER